MTALDIPSDQAPASTSKDIKGVLILLVIAAGFFYPMLFGGQVIFYRDYNLITYPIRYFLGQSFNQGAIPYWLPHIHGGEPFMASFHPGVFYPPSIVLVLPDTTYAINLFYVLHFLILGIFTFLLARSWKVSWGPAVACGMTAMLSGFMIAATLVSNLFMAAVWLPMVFWMFHQFWTRKHGGYFTGFVLAVAMQTLAACPEISILTMLLLWAHALFYFHPFLPSGGKIRLTGSMGLGVVLAMGLCALQLIPTAQLVPHTFRGGGLDFKAHSQWSATPEKLLTFAISPDYQHYFESRIPAVERYDEHGNLLETTGGQNPRGAGKEESAQVPQKSKFKQITGLLHTYYMGLVPLMLVLIALAFWRKRIIAFWLGVFWLGVFLALGKYNPVYQWVYSLLPFLKMFRYPEKYLYISCFASVFLAGYGIDELVRRTRDRILKPVPVIAFLVSIAGVIGWVAYGKVFLNPEYSLGLIAAFGFAWLMFYFKKLNQAGFVAMILLIVLVDLTMKGSRILPLIHRNFYDQPPALMNVVGDSAGKYRVYSGKLEQPVEWLSYPRGHTRLAQIFAAKEHLIPYGGLIYGVEHVNGKAGLALTLKDHMVWQLYFKDSPPADRRRILARSNVKYWVDGDSPTAYKGHWPLVLPGRVKPLNDPLPRAFLVPGMRAVEKDQGFKTYFSASFDPLKEVLLEVPVNFQPSETFEGEVTRVAYRPNGVTVKTRQEGHGFLVLLDSFSPGWTVTVDGEDRPILKADHFYRAVQLGPGDHTLDFEYVPEGFQAGLVVSGVSLLLMPFAAAILRRAHFMTGSEEKEIETHA